jgi:prepilin-type N-terminal cleavage/methylation domain-containing protein
MPEFIPLLRQPLNILGKTVASALTNIAGRSPKSPHPKTNSEQGVTLLECLVSISVIAILGAMIGPPIVFTAATRLQNQRAEQAFQIAQAEVDRIRALVARGQHEATRLPAIVPTIRGVGRPTTISPQIKSNVACTPAYIGQNVGSTQLIQVDVTGDCNADFLMQVFRTEGLRLPGGDTRPIDFTVGVRVYSVKIREANGSVAANISTRPASLSFAAGQGDMNRASRQRGPLAEFESDLIWSDRSEALCLYRNNPRC